MKLTKHDQANIRWTGEKAESIGGRCEKEALPMKPTKPDRANIRYGPPVGMSESQVGSMEAFVKTIKGGSCDGQSTVTVAWEPSQLDLARLMSGAKVYVTMMGGLVPHFVSTDFDEATKDPA